MGTHDVAGIILAGGQSRRMGCDKALLSLPDTMEQARETFIAHLAHLLKSFCGELVLVVRDNDQAARYRDVLSLSPIFSFVRFVFDETPHVGPLMGLFSGLTAIPSSHAFVTAVDTPFLQPALLAFLLQQPLTDRPLIPMIQGIPQVLLAIYPKAVLPIIAERLQSGRRDPRSLLEVTAVDYLSEAELRQVDPELRSFVNLNTPDDLARYTVLRF